jgi:hypothetical protein
VLGASREVADFDGRIERIEKVVRRAERRKAEEKDGV